MAAGGKREGAGRPEGSANKETKLIREKLGLLLDENFDKFQDEMKALKGKDFFYAFESLLEYSTPKLQKQEIKQEITKKVINVKFRDNSELPASRN